jgi:hypothetical protein
MRQRFGAILFLLRAVAVVSLARKEETLEQLIARADAAKPDQQPDLYMQVAEREFKAVNDAYKANQSDQFRTALQDLVKYSDSAHSSAMHANKHIKRTEIKIREISNKLRDLKLNVEIDDQPGVQGAIDRLEGFRTELLHSMFGSKNND